MRAFFILVSTLALATLLPALAAGQIKVAPSKSYTAPTLNRNSTQDLKSQQSPDNQAQKPSLWLKSASPSSSIMNGLSPQQKARFEKAQKSLQNMTRSLEGGVAGGGGNEHEADFVSLARILIQHLQQNEKRSSDALGFPLEEFQTAIDKTEVHCVADPNLMALMRELKKTAFFTTDPFRINLDCELYEAQKKNGDLGPITIFHEYMRAIGKDSSAYETSSKLMIAFFDLQIVRSDLLIDSGIAKCYRVLSSLESGAIPPQFQSVYEFGLGRAIAKCLAKEGFNLKVKPSMSSADIIEFLGRISLKTLSQFNQSVTSVLKRP